MKPKTKTKPVAVRLSDLEMEALTTIAHREGTTKSEVIRMAVREAVARRQAEPITLADILAVEVIHGMEA